ncbi:MAG: hypothetical protein ACD_79C00647G0005 [uncultured bacterium]|nr:MAG: hypothetical protein ACD_79C00647G0005 [uncultured bacterium]
MKSVFINISLRPDAKRRIVPVGLGYVLTAVKKHNIEFDLIDMDINKLSMKDLEEILNKNQYDIFAFGCIVTGFKWVKELSAIIKKINPDAVIIAGNSVATSIPEILLNNTNVDIAVLGEADITIVELLKSIELKKDISNIDGIAFRHDGKVIYTKKRTVIKNLDDIGFPDWNIFDLDKYRGYPNINTNSLTTENVNSFPLNSARGCPYKCTFCYHVFRDEKYRKYSKDAIRNEITRLYKDFECGYISFWDELTFPNIKSVEDMRDMLAGLDYKIGWEAVSRGDLFKKKDVGLIKELKSLGADNIAFSLENASEEILKAINKKLSVKGVIENSHALWEGGVSPLSSVIFGYPQETKESIQATIDVCEQSNIYPSVGFLLPLPGTEIYEWARQNGFIKDEVEYLMRIGDRQDFHINLTKMSDDEFKNTVTEKLRILADKQGLKLESVLKTTTYQKPKK